MSPTLGSLRGLARFEVEEAASGYECLDKLNAAPFAAVLLDYVMPGIDGIETLKRIREKWSKAELPVIMVTARDDDPMIIHSLEAGANDYVTKPFRFAVLLARIRAQLRQYEQSEDATFNVGPYVFKPAQKLLTEGEGKKIRLTEKEAAIIRYLFRAGQKAVTRDELLEEVWGYNSGVTTHTLETHVYRLRQKIEKDPSNAEILVTENGGYKIIP